jgi:hypothetical protein
MASWCFGATRSSQVFAATRLAQERDGIRVMLHTPVQVSLTRAAKTLLFPLQNLSTISRFLLDLVLVTRTSAWLPIFLAHFSIALEVIVMGSGISLLLIHNDVVPEELPVVNRSPYLIDRARRVSYQGDTPSSYQSSSQYLSACRTKDTHWRLDRPADIATIDQL